MCGIVGGTNPAWDYDAAVETLAARGPDARQIVRLDSVVLGFTRLAVIDVREQANQPMTSPDRRVWITYNGEIYGFPRLRAELERQGFEFRTRSDTEVVLNAYLAWGDEFVDRVDGMFAIGLYDSRTETLKLWRDRVGIKPLYCYFDGKHFAYASELKTIEALCGRQALSIDTTAVYDFLTYRYVPAPKSLYREVFKLEPGSTLSVALKSLDRIEQRRYWNVPDNRQQPFRGSRFEAADELRRLACESVREQLVADVPLGCFLSGGIDSSAVVSCARGATATLKTFSIGFGEADSREKESARLVSSRFDTQHREQHFSHALSAELFPRLRDWYTEPFADLSAFPTYFVSQLARTEVTVALSGDGGDELFGGYTWYRQFARLRFLARRWSRPFGVNTDSWRGRFRHGTLPRRALNLLDLVGDEPLELYARLLGAMTSSEKAPYAAMLRIPDDYDDLWHFRRYWRSDLPLLTRLQYLDFHTFLPDAVLTKVDRASMANSLEVRVPFLSRRLVEFAFGLPEKTRLPSKQPKGLFRKAFADLLPTEVLALPKRGFSVPRSYVPVSTEQVQTVILDRLFGIRPEEPARSSGRNDLRCE